MTHASVHFVCCSLHIMQKKWHGMSKRVASVRWHRSPIQKRTQMHTLLFSPYLPAYTPNHYDSDCSSRRLLPRQRWPRFHQIIQMTSSSVRVFVRVHARLYFISTVSIALSVVMCVCAHVRAYKNILKKHYHTNKKSAAHEPALRLHTWSTGFDSH